MSQHNVIFVYIYYERSHKYAQHDIMLLLINILVCHKCVPVFYRTYAGYVSILIPTRL